jgi:putative chitinase
MNSVLDALDRYGERFGLDRVHRSVQYLAQLMHESGDFRYDREIWGPTPAQKRYDTRTDLGNTPAADGDGKKYMGRTGGQLTGKANYQAFNDWCVKEGLNPPDFVANPDAVNTDPWEGLVPVWYWHSRNLNRYADQGDVETITKKINGGMNGFDDRVRHLVRLSLVVLGFGPDALRQFQASKGLDVDNDPGPKTRSALHAALVALTPGEAAKPEVTVAPVTEEKPVAVTPPSMDAPWWKSKEVLVPVATGGGLTSLFAAIGSMPWQNLVIVLLALGAAGGFLLWRKRADVKAVEQKVAG